MFVSNEGMFGCFPLDLEALNLLEQKHIRACMLLLRDSFTSSRFCLLCIATVTRRIRLSGRPTWPLRQHITTKSNDPHIKTVHVVMNLKLASY